MNYAIAVLLAMTPPTAAQQLPVATPSSSPEVAERSLALAQILNSEAIIIGDTKTDAEAIQFIQQLWGSREDLIDLEKENPGITRALAQELMPIVDRSARERLPELHQRQAALYSAHFDANELDTLVAFYRSPTGMKLVNAMMDNVKPKAIVAEASQSEDFKFGAESALKDIRAAVPDAVKAMDATDQAVLIRFAQSGVAPKLRMLAPKTQQVAIDWMGEEAPWEAAASEKAVERVLARFGLEKSE